MIGKCRYDMNEINLLKDITMVDNKSVQGTPWAGTEINYNLGCTATKLNNAGQITNEYIIYFFGLVE